MTTRRRGVPGAEGWGLLPTMSVHSEDETREELQAFCSRGRYPGTAGNQAAMEFLRDSLEREGYTAHVDVDKRRAVGPLIACMWFIPLVAIGWVVGNGITSAIAACLALGPMLKAAYLIATGVPLSVYGVRQDQSCDGGRPTIVLCAHFDSASLPIRGSFLLDNLLAVLIMVPFIALSRLMSAPVGILAAALYGVLFFTGNASPGGDDNASGVFTVLACVRRMKEATGVNIIPVFFNFEEEGLFGSRAWVAGHSSKESAVIPNVKVDPDGAYVLNFDCVGRGGKIFVSGNRELKQMVLATQSARELGAKATSLYPSDHLSFRRPWRAVAFARTNRFWAFDLAWLHSKADVPEAVRVTYMDELSRIVEDLVRQLSR